MERNRIDDNSFGQGKRPREPSGAAVKRQDVTDALTQAFFEEWAQIGYAALSLERVAKRAGVGKAALYRRWSSKHAMAVDLVKEIGLTMTRIPDSGSLEQDLLQLLLSLRRTLRQKLIRRILPDLHAEMARNGELSGEIRATLQYERRERAKVIIDRAVARGELPKNADYEIASDSLASILYWRIIVTGGNVSREEIEKIARFIRAGLGFDELSHGRPAR